MERKRQALGWEEGREPLNRSVSPAVLATRATRNSCHPVADRTLLNQRTQNRLKQVLSISQRSHSFAFFYHKHTCIAVMFAIKVTLKFCRTKYSFRYGRFLVLSHHRTFHGHFFSLITTWLCDKGWIANTWNMIINVKYREDRRKCPGSLQSLIVQSLR